MLVKLEFENYLNFNKKIVLDFENKDKKINLINGFTGLVSSGKTNLLRLFTYINFIRELNSKYDTYVIENNTNLKFGLRRLEERIKRQKNYIENYKKINLKSKKFLEENNKIIERKFLEDMKREEKFLEELYIKKSNENLKYSFLTRYVYNVIPNSKNILKIVQHFKLKNNKILKSIIEINKKNNTISEIVYENNIEINKIFLESDSIVNFVSYLNNDKNNINYYETLIKQVPFYDEHLLQTKDFKYYINNIYFNSKEKKQIITLLKIFDIHIKEVKFRNDLMTFVINKNNEPLAPEYFSMGVKLLILKVWKIFKEIQISRNIILFDEIENSFNLRLIKFIFQIFENKNINKYNSQLFFTTHNPIIFDNFETYENIFLINDDNIKRVDTLSKNNKYFDFVDEYINEKQSKNNYSEFNEFLSSFSGKK